MTNIYLDQVPASIVGMALMMTGLGLNLNIFTPEMCDDLVNAIVSKFLLEVQLLGTSLSLARCETVINISYSHYDPR